MGAIQTAKVFLNGVLQMMGVFFNQLVALNAFAVGAGQAVLGPNDHAALQIMINQLVNALE